VRGMLLQLLGPVMPLLLKWFLQRNAPETWASEMRQKGYMPVALFQTGIEAKAMRTEEQRRRDKEEEERIKNMAASPSKK